ncbi:insecticidal toxin complex protein TccC [Pseudomonas sp. SJZ080]|uniref:RHS repeat-associated core domain-containing protein n=1 Tax=Pseudomonas sp. SJZ080 TaxID=2572888 RepID=UPI00119A34D6|nr:RHS repeat-associated core domain-containing protein [Pseudomonas sp. SJZ080]TWC59259.1 insecticidal toxin complex protein TccC [Pseudomonas sp. SJZ080]
MQPHLVFIHRNTPKVAVVEPRGLAVRSVDYYRAVEEEGVDARVNRTVHDPAGRAIAQWDPRLFLNASAPANLVTIHGLSGTALCTLSVDAGLHVSLFGEAGQPVHSWDGRGSQHWMHYDNQLRLTALFEQAADGEAVCAERLNYAANDQAFVDHNQCGQLIRHDDPAGTQLFEAFGLMGGLLEQTRHFLRALESPDWPESAAECNEWLEPGPGATTHSRLNALGESVEQTDAQGNRQFFNHTVAGQLREVRLQLRNDTTQKTLVSAIQYNAHGQTEREVAGNGVITMVEYAPADGCLIRLHAKRGSHVLQDSSYEYDPAGNVLRIEDAAVPVRYFANQRIEPVNRYDYDSLDQLIRATGWEVGGTNKGPQFSVFDDPAPRGNYCQTYRYDRGGNLLELSHKGPQNHGHRLVAAPFSNRCLPVIEGVEPGEEDFRAGFDSNGNLLKLQPGQTLFWNLLNQLSEVRPVARDSAASDSERYLYGADGMRVRKVRSMQTNARTVMAEVRYLPSLEIRTHSGTGEVLHVISVQAGRSSVRVLHWETVPPKDSANDQYRYCLNDHLGSCTLELDSEGEVISQERYHPFGTTAWFAGRGEVEASRKTVRYSGKERDATGLYYYGFRYYVAWLQRWLSPDPAKDIESLNLYVFVSNSPVARYDREGLVSWPWSRSAQSMSSSVDKLVEVFNRDNNGRLRVMLDDERDKYGGVLEHLASFDQNTSALEEYVEGGSGVYAQINNELRSGQTSGDPELSSLMEELKQEVENLSEYEGEVYRATRTPPGVYGKLINKSDAVMDMAYMSTSAIPHHAIDWLETWVDGGSNNEKNERVIFIFDKSTTKKVASAGMLTDHVLIKPNAVFKVKDVRHIESAQYGSLIVVGLKPANDPSAKDIKNIFSGEVLLPAINDSVTRRIRGVFSRWLKS